jgi:uncharacterized protein (TIGR01777 family)
MQIVITGATGFLGRPLCAELVAKGHSVTALSRDAARAQSTLGSGIKCLSWGSGRDIDGSWREAVGKADTVIHLAGQSVADRAWTPEIKAELRRSRIETTRNLVEAIRAADKRPSALICASGINYYGDRGDEALTESSPPGTTFLSQLCIDWEAEALSAEALGLRVAVLRCGVVLEHGGPLDKMLFPLPLPISPWAMGLGGPLGSGRQWFPWIHLKDTVGMFVWAATDERVTGPVNAVAPGLVRNVEFSRTLGRVMHRPAVLPIPAFALKAIIGGFADELLTSQRAEPAVAKKLGYQFVFPEIEPALVAILARPKR